MPLADAQIQVARATPDRLPVLASVLARALANDPIFQIPFGGTGSIEEIRELAFRLYQKPSELGMVWEAGDGEGAAVWIPPGEARFLGVSTDADPVRAKSESDNGPSHQRVWDWLESYVDDDVWYLEVLGVDPANQNQGVGGALTRHGLGLAAADGAAAFLETSVARNVPYYERFGFEVVAEGDAPSNGPHVWFMRHEPAAD
jgi:ribosomal protein S18 acetylase RimI-like enzyme